MRWTSAGPADLDSAGGPAPDHPSQDEADQARREVRRVGAQEDRQHGGAEIDRVRPGARVGGGGVSACDGSGLGGGRLGGGGLGGRGLGGSGLGGSVLDGGLSRSAACAPA